MKDINKYKNNKKLKKVKIMAKFIRFDFIEKAVILWEKENVNDTVVVLDVDFSKDDLHRYSGSRKDYLYFVSNVLINGEKFKKFYEIDLDTNLICTSMSY